MYCFCFLIRKLITIIILNLSFDGKKQKKNLTLTEFCAFGQNSNQHLSLNNMCYNTL